MKEMSSITPLEHSLLFYDSLSSLTPLKFIMIRQRFSFSLLSCKYVNPRLADKPRGLRCGRMEKVTGRSIFPAERAGNFQISLRVWLKFRHEAIETATGASLGRFHGSRIESRTSLGISSQFGFVWTRPEFKQ